MADLTARELARPGCRISYRSRESASGEWAVFLHGAGMDGRMFDAQLPAVPPESGVICWDARGHGLSQLHDAFRYDDVVADLEAIVSAVAAERLLLVGQSMGGNLAQTFVSRHPTAVDRLVLIDCTANNGPLSRLDGIALRSTRTILSLYPWRMTVRQSARACGTAPATIRYAEECLRRMGKRRFIEVMGFWSDALDPDPAYRLPIPTLALVGAKDRSGNIAQAMTRLADTDPHVQTITISDAAHNSNMDQPAATHEHLRLFFGW